MVKLNIVSTLTLPNDLKAKNEPNY
jgi:hypothetical protein